ncbi:hypothetical protein PoB_003439600 [Plakobranchus ocellatus]|uniref:Uncharacterized protein n=1 Tax=Plakobranchus ocellatus TaxID=259542 RepID=A0AAV4AMU0_9GAST|nr:hypothetical protein PoB_003439600 [Plakobranchus ocellatus]
MRALIALLALALLATSCLSFSTSKRSIDPALENCKATLNGYCPTLCTDEAGLQNCKARASNFCDCFMACDDDECPDCEDNTPCAPL